MTPRMTIGRLMGEIATGATTGGRLIEQCLERIADPAGEGGRVFLKVHAAEARAAAAYYDELREHGASASPFSGIPVSIKDLFDMAGDVTTAGSRALCDAPPAARDATAVARLKAAGFIPVGRTNMTEFAYSALGINPHHGTPRNPYDRQVGRLPGGSSSGAAVSVADGMVAAALGSDTGGSCRVPAALCGIVGFKPTARRVPLDGVFPLAPSLDSVGPLARSVRCCAVMDAVLAGEDPAPLPPTTIDGLRLGVPQSVVLDDLQPQVADAFSRALTTLSKAGARVAELPCREFATLPRYSEKGGFFAAEAYAHHRELIADKGALYDPRVLSRLSRGAEQSAADYLDLRRARAALIRDVDRATAGCDALVMPTAPLTAPPLAALDAEDEYRRVNILLLRNPMLTNLLDRCAISLPCHSAGDAPVGLMVVGPTGGDRRLLAISAAIEDLVSLRTREAG